MRARARETAAAFGDTGDRDYQAEFGATVAAPKLTASAKVGPVLKPAATPAPKPASSLTSGITAALKSVSTAAVAARPTVAPVASLKVSAPVLKAATPAPVAKAATTAAAKAITSAALAAPTAAQKAASVSLFTSGATGAQNVIKAAPKPATPAPKPASSASSSKVATTALQGNFLDGGGAPLAAPNVKDPRSEAQKKADATALAKLKLEQSARETAANNAGYLAQRKKELDEHNAYVKRMQTEDTPEAREWRAREKRISEARIDWGLIPAGAAVLATGAAIVATGGAVAGALAAPSAATVAGAAVAADRALAAAEKAKIVKPGAAGAVGSVITAANTAQSVIDTTIKLAEQGVPAAIEGAKVIAQTAAERALSGAAPGVPQALTPQGAAAFDAYMAGATPALQAALATVTPAAASALAKRKPVVVSGIKIATVKAPIVEWFVSAAGKVTHGAVAVGSGWRVYSDGRVVKQ
jgi:trimeric autotransporter adhesin